MRRKWWKRARARAAKYRATLKAGGFAAVATGLLLGALYEAEAHSQFSVAAGIQALVGQHPVVDFIFGGMHPEEDAALTTRAKAHPYPVLSLSCLLICFGFFFSPTGRRVSNRLLPDPPPFLTWPLEPPGGGAASDEHAPLRMPVQAHPYARATPFRGRAEELQELNRFAGGTARFTWFAIYGQLGIGKTRLAVEWLQARAASKRTRWDVGALRGDQNTLERIAGWRPRRATAILVDETDRLPELWAVMEALCEAARRANHPVRVLLAEKGPPDADAILDSERKRVIGETRYRTAPVPAHGEAPASPADVPFRLVRPLTEEQDLRTIAAALVDPAKGEAGVERAIDCAEGHPFALITVALGLSLADKAERSVSLAGDAAGRKLLAVAALAGPLADRVRTRIAPQVTARMLRKLFPDGADPRKAIPPIAPELLAREVLLAALADLGEMDRQEVVAAAFEGNRAAALRMIRGLWRDRPERARAMRIATGVDAAAEAPEDRVAEVMIALDGARTGHLGEAEREAARRRAEDLVGKAGHEWSGDEPTRLSEALSVLEDVAADWPLDGPVQLERAAALHVANHVNGSLGRLPEMTSGYRLLCSIAEAWPSHREFQGAVALGAECASTHYGAGGDWEAAKEAIDLLEKTAAAWPSDEGIQIQRAKGALNAISFYGEAQQLPAVEKAIARLEETAAVWPRSEQIQLDRAKGAVSAILHYGTARDWPAMAAAIARLEETAAAWPRSEEIQLARAKGAVNAIAHLGAARDWPAMAAAIARLEETAAAWPRSEEIRLMRAKGAFNAIPHYGNAHDWPAMTAAMARLEETAAAWPRSEEIQLARAYGAFNAIPHYGNAHDWPAMAAAIARLEETAAAWPRSEEIQLARAKGAGNAIAHYGNAHDWPAMAAAIAGLEETAAAWPRSEEIQLARFMGAFNAILRYGEGGLRHEGAAALSRLAEVAREWPGNLEIQQGAHEFGVSYAQQQSA